MSAQSWDSKGSLRKRAGLTCAIQVAGELKLRVKPQEPTQTNRVPVLQAIADTGYAELQPYGARLYMDTLPMPHPQCAVETCHEGLRHDAKIA